MTDANRSRQPLENPCKGGESGDGGNRTRATFPPTASSRGRCDCDDTPACVYCGRQLHGCHEHDHFPVPFRAGGIETVATCRDCHDLKDRLPFHKWPASAASEFLQGLSTPEARIAFASLLAELHDLRAQLAALVSGRPEERRPRPHEECV